ncbi:uncharacterized protein LOC134726070 [Mytilus trossulus]|uniref:uncharacterized protein LOC134726070 n=1 Tax=Mytilus trossulus TaxID=6551 RepID=UPI003006B6FF
MKEKYGMLKNIGFNTEKHEALKLNEINFSQIEINLFTNGVLLELDQLRRQHGASLRYLLKWSFQLLSIKDDLCDNNIRKLNFGLRKLYKVKLNLSKTRNGTYHNRKNEFLHKVYCNYPNEIIVDSNESTENSTVNKETLTKLENAFNKVTIQSKVTKTENTKLKIENINREKIIQNLEKKLKMSTNAKQNNHESTKKRDAKKNIHVLKTNIKSLEKRLLLEKMHIKTVKTICRMEKKRLNGKIKYWEGIANKTRHEKLTAISTQEIQIQELRIKIKVNEDEIKRYSKIVNEQAEQIDYLTDLNDRTIDLTTQSKNGQYTYNSQTDQCVMDLLDCGLSFEKVGPAIKNVLSMCGLRSKDDRYPKKDYVSNCNMRRLAISQVQTAEICTAAANQTLYTDETRKFGETFSSFITTDENKTPFLLGLKQMSNKAAQTQLDTLKSILNDIETRINCLVDQNLQTSKSFNILKNIKYTMSDRAATEIGRFYNKKELLFFFFNQLLKDYRDKLLKEHVEQYDDLPDVEKDILSRMYNFFCGLHLTVNIADVINKVFMQTKNIEDFDSDFSHEKAGEADILRALRCVCKAFAVGGDEKCGTSLEFKTYLNRNDIKTVDIKPFHGNRFNIVFHNGGTAFHLRDYIHKFLTEVKSEGHVSKLNGLLRAVLKSIKVPEIITGFRALGICNKFITTPLLKVLENKSTHIFDMNQRYQTLVTYLENVSVDLERTQELLTGEYVPFPDIAIKKDDVWASLVHSENDAPCAALLVEMCSSVCKALKDKVADHLEDGQFSGNHETDREQFSSVLPHNKLPERVFGQLDWLLRHRPNASKIANEAHIMYSMNRTANWLQQKDDKKVEELISWSKKNLKSMKETEKLRIQELDSKLKQISIDKENRTKALAAKSKERKESLTQEIVKLGFWDKKGVVNAKLKKLKTQTAKRNALKYQINFRNYVLEQKADIKYFRVTKYQRQTVTINQLKTNLLTLISMTTNNCESRENRSEE